MKIFRRQEGKTVAIDTDAYNKMKNSTKSNELSNGDPMSISEDSDLAFGKLEYYNHPKKGKTEDEEKRINKVKNEIKRFFKY